MTAASPWGRARPTAPRSDIKDATALRQSYGLVVADVERLGDAELELLAADADRRLADAPAEDVLAWARLTFGDRLVVLASMADGVVANLAGRVAPGVDVGFLDTGLHFIETLGTRDAIAATLPINVITAVPALSLADQERDHGPALWERDPDRCCALRKVEPLARLLGLGDRSASRREREPRGHAGRRLGRTAPQGQGQPDRGLDRRGRRGLCRPSSRAGQPAQADRLCVHRLRAVHSPGRRG